MTTGLLTAIESELAFAPTTEYAVPYAEGADMRESAALLSDGRVIYVWREGGAIRQGYATSVTDFYVSGSVGNVTDVLTGLGQHSAAVFQAPTGLHLLVARQTPTAGVTLYSSPSNLGGDWLVKSVLDGPTSGGDEGGFNMDQFTVGPPHISGSIWAVPAATYQYVDFLNLHRALQGIFTSQDAGLTWVRTFSTNFYFFGAYGDGGGRGLGVYDGKLWYHTDGFSPNSSPNAYSTNDGVTWTGFGPLEGLDRTHNWTYVGGDPSYLYRFATNGLLERTTTPLDDGSWVAVYDFPLVDGGPNLHAAIVQRLGTTVMVAAGGRVLVPPGGGWVVGYVTA